MLPHRPWRPAATERRLSLARRFSSLLTRRSAQFPLSIPRAARKGSRPMSASGSHGVCLCSHDRLDAGEGSRVSRNRLRGAGNRELPPALAIVIASAGRGSLFLPGLEHSTGDPGYEAAGDEALAVGAEVISEAGNHITFAGGQRFQSRARDFFRGLGVSKEFFLAGHGMEFGLRGARAKSAHADSIWFHFFGEPFCEKQI